MKISSDGFGGTTEISGAVIYINKRAYYYYYYYC